MCHSYIHKNCDCVIHYVDIGLDHFGSTWKSMPGTLHTLCYHTDTMAVSSVLHEEGPRVIVLSVESSEFLPS